MVHILKVAAAHTILRPGTVRTIRRGPAKGLRYRIFPEFGLAPLLGRWERDAQLLMVRHIRSGSVVYDVGANFGIHALLFARLVGAEGQVYAFEPVPAINAAGQENMALNGFSNVTYLPLAVGDSTGSESFVTGHHQGAGHLVGVDEVAGSRFQVSTTTLDDFVCSGHRPPDFIKIDVEGAESRVLQGGEHVLRHARPILLLDLHSPEQDVAVGRMLEMMGYKAYHTDSTQRVLDMGSGWPDPDGLFGQVIAFPTAEGRRSNRS